MTKAKARIASDFMTQLRRYRLAAGMGQAAFAKRVGVSIGAVSRWELGKDVPQGERFPKIARILGIKPIELTMLIDPEPPGQSAK